MLVKIHHLPGNRIMLAACDKQLAGKKFMEHHLQLDLSTDFYKGAAMDKDKLTVMLRRAHITNLVGATSVEFGVAAGVIDRSSVKKICGIPYAQSFMMN